MCIREINEKERCLIDYKAHQNEAFIIQQFRFQEEKARRERLEE
jgi:hypothetical protein